MGYVEAILLGFVQGVTEWLPISSTAHLRVVPVLLGWSDPGAAFTAIVQWGTVLAALVYFRRDLVALLGRGRSEVGVDRRLLVPIGLGTLPILVCGVLLKHSIEVEWRSLYVVAGSMAGFALLLALAEARYKAARAMGTLTLMDGLIVGIGQAFALIPGASRSGTTMTAALLLGLERSTAARFSFLLSLPAAFAAGLKECWDERSQIAATEIGPLLVATAIAFIVGLASIHWFMGFLRSHSTYCFVAYRIVVAAAVLALVSARIVPAIDRGPGGDSPADSPIELRTPIRIPVPGTGGELSGQAAPRDRWAYARGHLGPSP